MESQEKLHTSHIGEEVEKESKEGRATHANSEYDTSPYQKTVHTSSNTETSKKKSYIVWIVLVVAVLILSSITLLLFGVFYLIRVVPGSDTEKSSTTISRDVVNDPFIISPEQEANRQVDTSVFTITEFTPVVGANDASIVMYYFHDLLCPACAAQQESYTDFVAEIQDGEYANTSISMVYKQLPLVQIHGETARLAARDSIAVYRTKPEIYSDYITEIFNTQNNWSKSTSREVAVTLGIDADEFDRLRNSSEVAQAVDSDIEQITEVMLPARLSELGINKESGTVGGTPTFLIVKDGELMRWWTGAKDSEQLFQSIDAVIAGE